MRNAFSRINPTLRGFASGLDSLAFILVLGLCGLSMWRVWRDEHTYSR